MQDRNLGRHTLANIASGTEKRRCWSWTVARMGLRRRKKKMKIKGNWKGERSTILILSKNRIGELQIEKLGQAPCRKKISISAAEESSRKKTNGISTNKNLSREE